MIRNRKPVDLLNEKNVQLVFIMGATIIALALRFYRLDEWSLWIEEHHTIRHALNTIGRSPFELLYGRPLFYFGILQMLKLFGVNEWAARLGPALIGIITIPIFYIITKKLIGLRVAAIGTILMAVAPWHLYWSQNARFYSLVLILYFSSLALFFFWTEKDQIGYLIASFVILIFVSLIQQMAILLVPVFLSYVVLLSILPFEKPAVTFSPRNILLLVLVPVAAYIVYEGYYVYRHGYLFASVIYRQFFNEATLTFIGYENPYVTLTAVTYYIGTPIVILSVVGSIFLLVKRERIGLLLSLGAFLPLIIIMALTLIASVANRYVFMTLPCWIVLAAVGIDGLLDLNYKRKNLILLAIIMAIVIFLLPDPVLEDYIHYTRSQPLLLVLPAVIVLVFGFIAIWQSKSVTFRRYSALIYVVLGLLAFHHLAFSILYFTFQHGHRNNWREATAVLAELNQAGDPIFSSGSGSVLAQYYLKENVIPVEEDLGKLSDINGRIWFLEDFTLAETTNNKFDGWAKENCEVVDSWVSYTGGRDWNMRVHRCDLIATEKS